MERANFQSSYSLILRFPRGQFRLWMINVAIQYLVTYCGWCNQTVWKLYTERTSELSIKTKCKIKDNYFECIIIIPACNVHIYVTTLLTF